MESQYNGSSWIQTDGDPNRGWMRRTGKSGRTDPGRVGLAGLAGAGPPRQDRPAGQLGVGSSLRAPPPAPPAPPRLRSPARAPAALRAPGCARVSVSLRAGLRAAGPPPPRGGAGLGSPDRPAPAPRGFSPSLSAHDTSLRRDPLALRGETEAGRRVKWARVVAGERKRRPCVPVPVLPA